MNGLVAVGDSVFSVLVSENAYQVFVRCPPSTLKKFSDFLLALSDGYVPDAVVLRNTAFQSIPFVFVREVEKDLFCFFTVSMASSPDHHLCRVWGAVQTRPLMTASFPFGGPWFPVRGRDEITMPELDIKQLPVWCQIADVPESWNVCLRWFQVKRSQSLKSRTPAIAWESFRTRLRALPPVLNLIRAIENDGKAEAPTEVANAGLGLLPVLTYLPARELIEALRPVLTAGDAVFGASQSLLDFTEFDTAVSFWTLETGKGVCQTLVLWYPSEQMIPEYQAEDRLLALLPILKRARRMVLIVDHFEAIRTWHNRLAGLVYLAQDLKLLSLCLRGPSKKQSWLQLGRAYFEAHLPIAATLCFECADATLWLNRVRGTNFSARFSAVDHFQGVKWDQNTAVTFERMERWDLALSVWRRLGDEVSALRCRIELHRQKGEWLKAARLLLRHGQYQAAGQALESAGKYRRAMRLYLEHVSDPERVVALCERVGEELYGAKLLERSGFHEQALKLYQRCGHGRGLERMLHVTGRFNELEERLVAREDRERLLAFYEQRGDVKKYMELLSDQAVSRHDAATLFAKQHYFRAYVHALLVNDWALAGSSALKIGDYEGAANAYLQVGMTYEAGVALSKTQHLKRALELLLSSEQDGPKFSKASRVLARIKDRRWLKLQAEGLMAKGAYVQAAWLSERLGLRLLHGEIRLVQGRVQEAIALWGALNTAREVDDICAICLSRGFLEVGVYLLIDQKIGFAAWQKGEFSPDATPSVFTLAWRYFSSNQDHVRLDSWVSRLSRGNPLLWAAHLLPALELLGDWRSLLSLLAEWRSNPAVWTRFVEQTLGGDERVLSLSQEGRAVRRFLMNDPLGFGQAIDRVVMTEKNAPLFLLRASFEVAHSFLTYEKMTGHVVGGSHPICLDLAREALKHNLFRVAAVFYLQVGDEVHALEALETGGEFELLGKLCMSRGFPLRAVAAFERMAKIPYRQVAQAYEQAALWDRALACYELAGDGRGRRRCLQRMNRHLQGSLLGD